MPVAHPETLRETVKLLYLQGVRPSIIIQETGVNPGTLKTWAARHGWTKAARRTSAIIVNNGKNVIKRLSGETSAIRDALHAEAKAQVQQLIDRPPQSIAELANTPEREGRTTVFKKLTETVSMIEDWDAQKRSGLVLCDLLTGEPGSTTEIAAQVESVPSVSDATTGSVPTGDLNALTDTSVQAAAVPRLTNAPTNDNRSCAKSDPGPA